MLCMLIIIIIIIIICWFALTEMKTKSHDTHATFAAKHLLCNKSRANFVAGFQVTRSIFVGRCIVREMTNIDTDTEYEVFAALLFCFN